MIGRLRDILGIALLAGAALWSIVHVGTQSAREIDPSITTIRIAHWQLEAGMREAFDAVAAEYQRLHPNVRIVQIAVPGRVYGTYLRTQQASDDPPDLMELGVTSDEILARHFAPLGPAVERPNPYNRGTDLENVPWRDTFLDGLASSPGLETLLDYYGVPTALVTVRMYYNRSLYQEIFGDRPPPRDFDEFLDVCRRTREFAVSTGRAVWPVAGSRFNANILLDRLFRSQTQRLAMEIDPMRSLRAPEKLAFLNDRVTLDHPAIQSGLHLMRDVATQMPSGFMQFDRDQAIFHFAQGRALMIATGSWDYRSIQTQSPFPIGIFALPAPTAQHPRYGKYSLGPVSEAGKDLATKLHLSARSRNPDVAIDFLQLLTSRPGNQIFADHSKWIPAIVGVRVPAEAAPFAPVSDGYPDGFAIAPIMWGSGEVFRVQSNHLHLLLDSGGSVERFVAAMKKDLPGAVRDDAAKQARDYFDNIRRQDTTLAALRHLQPPATRPAGKLSSLWETQNAQELLWHWLQSELAGEPTR